MFFANTFLLSSLKTSTYVRSEFFVGCVLYFTKSDMLETTFNLSFVWQVCNSNCNLFCNIALKTKIDHGPIYVYPYIKQGDPHSVLPFIHVC